MPKMECTNCGAPACPWIDDIDKEGRPIVVKCDFQKERDLKKKVNRLVYDEGDRPVKTFDEIEFNINPIQKQIENIKKWITQGGQRLFLSSNCGTGKTTILQAVMIELIKKGNVVNYFKAQELHRLFSAESSEITPDERGDLNLFRKAKVQIVDELLQESTVFFENKLSQLFEDPNKRVIVASNYLPQNYPLDEKYRSALHLKTKERRYRDRLGSFRVERWIGKSYREMEVLK